MIDLIATDMDGTLLDDSGRVSATTRPAIAEAAAAGVEVVVATGRSHWTAIPPLEGIDDIRWVLCSNGATLYDRRADAIAFQRTIDRSLVEQVLAASVEHHPDVGVAWETPDGLYWSPEFLAARTKVRPGFSLHTRAPVVDADLRRPIVKILLAHPELVQLDWLDALVPHLPVELNASTSGADFVEVSAPEAEKGRAMAALCAELGVAAERVAAFGDHSNDLGLLRWAGRGYAMANASDRVAAAVELRAPHHAEHGVAQVVRSLLKNA